MNRSLISFASVAAASLIWGAVQAAAAPAVTFRSQHTDYRRTPKYEQYADAPVDAARTAMAPEAVARDFLAAHAASYGIASVDDLSLTQTQESLLGFHFRFAQAAAGVAVDDGEVVVSVAKATHEVYSAYNNFFPGTPAARSRKAPLGTDKAYDAAWSDLKVHGKLQSAPKSKLVYRVDAKGAFRLVYVTYLNTAAPFGAWSSEVDAATGKVLARADTAIERKASRQKKADPSRYRGRVLDRKAAFAAFAAAQQKKAAFVAVPADRRNGKGLVFDPDPRTTLNDVTLEDDSPAAALDAAYFTRNLLDLSFAAGKYTLDGPWVKIGDFESPTTAPSTTTDGQWKAKRGDNAFDDAMVYFHLDQSQRYLQSLGFTGNKAIQGASIEADTDGVDGDDNSHYVPTDNRLAYGHGCVDDDEDSDVILHEYGHAITFSINSNFNDGDAGAMGEGFGDYWAASYSISQPGGLTYKPYEIYSWDGHGATDACWAGRVLNATEMMYDPATTYGAHVPIGDHQSDELWSTPLFETLMSLVQQGVPRSEVDQIILEGQFGFSAGMTMRELAESTIAAAKHLQPNGPHADVFVQKFQAQQIILTPQAILSLNKAIYGSLGADGVADPGETITLRVALGNTGTLPASGIHATVTSQTGGVTVEDGSLSFTDVAAGAVATSANTAHIAIGALDCGAAVKLTVTVTFAGGLSPSVEIPIEFNLGKADGMNVSATPNVAIPDNDESGVTVKLTVTAGEKVTSNFAVDLKVQHSYVGDLTVSLTSPSGQTVVLHKDGDGGATDDIDGRYPTTLTPAEPLSKFIGEPMKGDWKLKLVDGAADDTGKLLGWGLFDVAGYECQR